MKSWKRRTRGIRKINRKLWFYKYLHQGVELRKLYKMYLKNELRKKRLLKRIMENIRKESEGKDYFEDCNYLPCKITLLDFDNDDIEGIQLVSGKGSACSLRNCAPVFLTEEEATERASYIKDHGVEAYYQKYLGPEEGLEKVEV